jgi:uncharacterized membrane protein YkvA (DUF1232 family)
MKIRDFLSSKWCRGAFNPEVQAAIARGVPKWRRRIRNTGLLEKSGQLWVALTGKGTSKREKVLIAGALLYLMTPLDVVSDLVPLVGWLDDLGVAGWVLGYLSRKMDVPSGAVPDPGREPR